MYIRVERRDYLCSLYVVTDFQEGRGHSRSKGGGGGEGQLPNPVRPYPVFARSGHLKALVPVASKSIP